MKKMLSILKRPILKATENNSNKQRRELYEERENKYEKEANHSNAGTMSGIIWNYISCGSR